MKVPITPEKFASMSYSYELACFIIVLLKLTLSVLLSVVMTIVVTEPTDEPVEPPTFPPTEETSGIRSQTCLKPMT